MCNKSMENKKDNFCDKEKIFPIKRLNVKLSKVHFNLKHIENQWKAYE